MPTVHLGNPNPIFNGQATAQAGAVTVVHIPDSRTPSEAMRDVCHDDGGQNTGLWCSHGAGMPSWVECSDPDLAAMLAAHFGCPIGRPA